MARSQRRETTPNTTQYPSDLDTEALLNTGQDHVCQAGICQNGIWDDQVETAEVKKDPN